MLRSAPAGLLKAYHQVYADRLDSDFNAFAKTVLGKDSRLIEGMAKYLYEDKYRHQMTRDEFDAQSGLLQWREQMVDGDTDESGLFTTVTDVPRAAVSGLAETPGRWMRGAGQGIEAGAHFLEEGVRAIGLGDVADALDRVDAWVNHQLGDDAGYADPVALLKSAGQATVDVAQGIGPPDERKTLGTDVAHAVGQIGAQITAAILSGGVSSAVSLGSMYALGADIQGEMTEAAGAEGTHEGEAAVLIGGTITAVTERVGLEKLLSRMPKKIRGRIMEALVDVGVAGGIEAVQEVTEGIMHNLTALALYDENQQVLDGVSHEAIVAGSAGAIARGLIRTALPGRFREGQPEAEQAQPEPGMTPPEPGEGAAPEEPVRNRFDNLPSKILQEEAKAGSRTELMPRDLAEGTQVLVDSGQGPPEVGTVLSATEVGGDAVVRIVNAENSVIAVIDTARPDNPRTYSVAREDVDQAEVQEAEKHAQIDDEITRLLDRAQADPEFTAEKLEDIRKSDEFLTFDRATKDSIDDFLIEYSRATGGNRIRAAKRPEPTKTEPGQLALPAPEQRKLPAPQLPTINMPPPDVETDLSKWTEDDVRNAARGVLATVENLSPEASTALEAVAGEVIRLPDETTEPEVTPEPKTATTEPKTATKTAKPATTAAKTRTPKPKPAPKPRPAPKPKPPPKAKPRPAPKPKTAAKPTAARATPRERLAAAAERVKGMRERKAEGTPKPKAAPAKPAQKADDQELVTTGQRAGQFARDIGGTPDDMAKTPVSGDLVVVQQSPRKWAMMQIHRGRRKPKRPEPVFDLGIDTREFGFVPKSKMAAAIAVSDEGRASWRSLTAAGNAIMKAADAVVTKPEPAAPEPTPAKTKAKPKATKPEPTPEKDDADMPPAEKDFDRIGKLVVAHGPDGWTLMRVAKTDDYDKPSHFAPADADVFEEPATDAQLPERQGIKSWAPVRDVHQPAAELLLSAAEDGIPTFPTKAAMSRALGAAVRQLEPDKPKAKTPARTQRQRQARNLDTTARAEVGDLVAVEEDGLWTLMRVSGSNASGTATHLRDPYSDNRGKAKAAEAITKIKPTRVMSVRGKERFAEYVLEQHDTDNAPAFESAAELRDAILDAEKELGDVRPMAPRSRMRLEMFDGDNDVFTYGYRIRNESVTAAFVGALDRVTVGAIENHPGDGWTATAADFGPNANMVLASRVPTWQGALDILNNYGDAYIGHRVRHSGFAGSGTKVWTFLDGAQIDFPSFVRSKIVNVISYWREGDEVIINYTAKSGAMRQMSRKLVSLPYKYDHITRTDMPGSYVLAESYPAMSPEALDTIERAVQSEATRLLPPDVLVELVPGVLKSVRGSRAGTEAVGLAAPKHIIVSAIVGDPTKVLRHESVHALKASGHISEAEWSALEQASADNGWLERYDVKNRWTFFYKDGKPTASAVEESIAEAFAEYAGNQDAPIFGKSTPENASLLKRVFQRIWEYFHNLRRRLLGLEIPITPNSVFDDINAGVVGSRGWKRQETIREADPQAFIVRRERPEGTDTPKFENAETERRWHDATKGVQHASFGDRVAEGLTRQWRRIVRHREHIEENEYNADLIEKMRHLEAASEDSPREGGLHVPPRDGRIEARRDRCAHPQDGAR